VRIAAPTLNGFAKLLPSGSSLAAIVSAPIWLADEPSRNVPLCRALHSRERIYWGGAAKGDARTENTAIRAGRTCSALRKAACLFGLDRRDRRRPIAERFCQQSSHDVQRHAARLSARPRPGAQLGAPIVKNARNTRGTRQSCAARSRAPSGSASTYGDTMPEVSSRAGQCAGNDLLSMVHCGSP
jgi:hypothetical protein